MQSIIEVYRLPLGAGLRRYSRRHPEDTLGTRGVFEAKRAEDVVLESKGTRATASSRRERPDSDQVCSLHTEAERSSP